MLNDSESPLAVDPFPWYSWKDPDYERVMRIRMEWLNNLRRDPGLLAAVREFYADDHYVEFIRDWGMTRDPRNAARSLPTVFPFIPWPRQVELLHWLHEHVMQRRRGNVDKTRDCGASWIALGYCCWRFLFKKSNDIGVGSRKEDLIDTKDDPKALFPKARSFIKLLPEEFRPKDWNERLHAPYMRLINPENGSTIVGEAGDNIGRGGRTLLYVVDEAAFIDHPTTIEGALSENTNTQINISTHNGPDTVFLRQCQTMAKDDVFEFDWREDPRKDQEWYDRKKSDPTTDPVIFAQEVDRDPSASISDGFIGADLVTPAMESGVIEAFASGPFIVSVDCAGMGNDETVITTRRGAFVEPQIVFKKRDGTQVAAEVERHCDNLLRRNIAALGAIIYELEGPGYEMHGILKTGRYAEALRPIHPGRKLPSPEFYNERARFWKYAKEWLEEGGKKLPNDIKLKAQLCGIRYEYRVSGDKRLLLIEDKKQYKRRNAPDAKNPQAGPSPDRADSFVLGFAPVKFADIRRPKPQGVLPDDIFFSGQAAFQPLDRKVGW